MKRPSVRIGRLAPTVGGGAGVVLILAAMMLTGSQRSSAGAATVGDVGVRARIDVRRGDVVDVWRGPLGSLVFTVGGSDVLTTTVQGHTLVDRFKDGETNTVVYDSIKRLWHDLHIRFLVTPGGVSAALQRGTSAPAPRVFGRAHAQAVGPSTTVYDFGTDVAALAQADPNPVIFGGPSLGSMGILDAQLSAGTESSGAGFDWNHVSTVIYSDDLTGSDPNANELSISTALPTSDWGAADAQFYDPSNPDISAGGLSASVANEYTLVTKTTGVMVSVSTTWPPTTSQWTSILGSLVAAPASPG